MQMREWKMKTHRFFFRLWLIGPVMLSCLTLADDGLIGRYYNGYSVSGNRIGFDGLTLVKTETNTVFNFWNGSQYDDWNPIGSGPYSVRWTGYLQIPHSGLYGFGSISDDGSEIWIDDARVVDNHEEQWFDWQEVWCYLGAGYHTIEITFFDNMSYSGIEVWWLKPENAPSIPPYSGETFHTIPPTFNAGTQWKILSAPAVQTHAPYVNPQLRAEGAAARNTVTLTWQGFTNVTYTLESSTNLTTWQDRTAGLPGISRVMTQQITTTLPREFFRLRLEE